MPCTVLVLEVLVLCTLVLEFLEPYRVLALELHTLALPWEVHTSEEHKWAHTLAALVSRGLDFDPVRSSGNSTQRAQSTKTPQESAASKRKARSVGCSRPRALSEVISLENR